MVPQMSTTVAITQPTILLVEDEVVVRMMLGEAMRDAGWTVVETASADEAWTYLRAGGPAQLMFSDVTMPGSMNGLALKQLVRDSFPATKIILTSGNFGPGNLNDLDGFIQKPYLFSDALAMAAKLLGLTATPEAP
jgi:two-component system, response regulator PdtaR